MKRLGRKGFTLIELLMVMGIMMVMAGFAISAYFGIMRGSAMRAALSHLRSTLQLARQSAILHGRNVYVILGQDTTNSWYLMCREEGTATDKDIGTVLVDRYAVFSKNLIGATIYNLDTGEGSVVSNVVSNAVVTADSIWSTPTYPRYGWEIYPETRLPRGCQFGCDNPPEDPPTPWLVRFNTDGTTRGSDYEISIYEKIRMGQNDGFGRVTVKAFTGFVTTTFMPGSE